MCKLAYIYIYIYVCVLFTFSLIFINSFARSPHLNHLAHLPSQFYSIISYLLLLLPSLSLSLCLSHLFFKVDRDGSPQCARTLKVVHGKPVTITCVTAHEDLSLLAVGMATGDVYIYKGDILKDRLTSKFIKVPAESAVVTGLAFRQTARDVVLFIATGGHVCSFSMNHETK